MPVTEQIEQDVQVQAGDVALEGHLAVPEDAVGVVLFAHGSGSSRHSRRNQAVARAPQRRGPLPLRSGSEEVRFELGQPRLERAIGVIYRSDTELQSHYFAADLPNQFDEYVWFDESEAVRPLGASAAPAFPERHPFRLLAD